MMEHVGIALMLVMAFAPYVIVYQKEKSRRSNLKH